MQKDKSKIQPSQKKILTACIGQCVHVAGIINFIEIAQQLGYKYIFLGPAVPNEKIVEEIKDKKPEIIGLSYRLTPSTVKPLLQDFFDRFDKLSHKPEKLFIAGTPEVIEIAQRTKRFDEYFVGGESRYEIISALKNRVQGEESLSEIPMNLIERIKWKKPYPIVRAHFGLPSLDDTIEGISKIANACVLDIISLAPDQNTQANYFHPEDQDKNSSGAGGVPIRIQGDFEELNKARLTGNKPLLRIYAGTRDFIKLARLFNRTINNAWAAIPIFWFNQMDRRGPLTLKESIKQHINAIRWHGKNNIPVEINDPHHWSLRNSPDVIAIADMFLCGIIAKKVGVKNFIAQFMFNTPPNSSLEMDLAKMLAKNELLQTLEDDSFHIIKQVRTGLASFPLNLNKAKGQLATATLVQLALKPDIIHVVTHSEASHAATPEDIIESCEIVEQVINKVYSSDLNFISKKIIERKKELIDQAKWIIDFIPRMAKSPEELENPYINHNILKRLVKYGIFDAPHLKNNQYALGNIDTKMIDGACYSWDHQTQDKIDEIQRIKDIYYNYKHEFISDKKLNQKLKKEVEI